METNKITDELAEKINRLKEHIHVAISSGRSLVYLQNMYSKIMGGNVILQAENGNLSLYNGELYQHHHYDDEYFEKLAKIRNDTAKLDIKGFEPKQFILTIHSEKEHERVYKIVSWADLDKSCLKVLWNGEAFDVQHVNVSKGEGVKALGDMLRLKMSEILAVGDKINDKEMVETAGIGVSTCKETLEAEHYMSAEDVVDALLAIHEAKEGKLCAHCTGCGLCY